MKHYIYKTTNLINGKIYIGYHHSEDIDNDPYLGSGDIFLRAVRYHGKNNFRREILFEFDNQDEAYKKERELIDEDFIKQRDNYNMTLGGKGWTIGCETHNKNKIAIYSPITNKNYYVNVDDLQKFLDDGYILGSKTKDHRLCIKRNDIFKYINPPDFDVYAKDGWVKSNTTHNKICVTHITTKTLKYINENELELYQKNGYELGNLKSGVNKGKIYVSKNDKNKRIDISQLEYYLENGWEQKRFQKELKIKRMYNPINGVLKNIPIDLVNTYLNDGWILGRNYSTNKNKIGVIKNNKNKYIGSEELMQYLNEGWALIRKIGND